jgi:hypothetical protein
VLATLYGRTYVADNGWSCVTVIGDSAVVGIGESFKPQVTSRKQEATVVRGVLSLEWDRPGTGTGPGAVLLNISGRKVLDLYPGPNDVRALASGVYFVREEQRATSLKPQAVTKVVLAR